MEDNCILKDVIVIKFGVNNDAWCSKGIGKPYRTLNSYRERMERALA